MNYYIITETNWTKLRDENLEPCRELPQGIRRKKQAHGLAAQRRCVPAAEHQQAHLAALSGYGCTAVYTNRTQVLLQARRCGNTASYEVEQT